MMDNLISLSIRSHRVVLMMLAFIMIAGSVTYVQIPKESSPDVQVPIIYVSMFLEGISPEDGERLLIRPMEKQLRTIDNVKNMTATAQEGFASVTLEFRAGFNPDAALADVRAAVDIAKAELPAEADEPKVNEVNFSQFPVVNVVLSGNTDERTLITLARRLRDDIEGVSAVLEAKIAGEREEVLEILIDPRTLEGYNINPAEVLRRVQNNNILIAAGQMDHDHGQFRIKLSGLIENAKDLMHIPIINTKDKVVVLKDIATIRRTFKDAQSHARINGKPSVGIAVSKRAGANLIDTIAEVKKVVDRERAYWPSYIEVSYTQDTSDEVREMLSDLENNIVFAVLLVLLMVLLTMEVRSALLVASSIPASFLMGVLVLGMMGYTMNIVVLFSMILASGMVVDAAIVVCEYADRLMHQHGFTPKHAFQRAASRMFMPIFSSVLMGILVFLPLLFWPGIVGQFMKYMPITMIVVLFASLIVALIFIPTMGAVMRSKKVVRIFIEGEDEHEIMSDHPFTQRYVALLKRILHRPWRTVCIQVGGVFAVYAIFFFAGPGVEFFPDIEPKNANILVRSVGNLSLEEKDRIMKQVEKRIAPLKNEVRFFFTQAGATTVRDIPLDTIGIVQLEFVSWRYRRPAAEILNDARQRLMDLSGVIIETAKQQEGPPTGKALQLEFSSRDPDRIAPMVTRVVDALAKVEGLRDIEDDRPKPAIEWEYEVDREKAGRNDVSVAQIGQVLKLATNGVKVNAFRPDDADDEIDIVVRFPETFRTLDQLAQQRVFTSVGSLEPISNFVKRVAKNAITTIQRSEGLRTMTIKADVKEGVVVDSKVQEVADLLKTLELDPEVSIRFKGEDEEQKEAMQFLSIAFAIALFAMVVLLTAQFNSYYRMFVIMTGVFLSTGGVLIGHLISGAPFGIVMSGVGVITLAGVVVNNNIILIDTFDVLRKQGMKVQDALLLAASVRLRPILLTAGTTVLGLIPMALSMNINFVERDITIGAPSSQWWVQLSTAIAGGLSFATVLTLLVTPAFIMLRYRKLDV
ncbi:MAG: efflux RND transporter permease subunit [Alphaproteobacteria bacterium]|nr:MAG: efflux RND transporter permease subunit [Alphaproteobacteria bacterium]